MPLVVALLWTERLAAFALALQTIELLQLRRAWSDTGIWRWSLLRAEQRALPWPLRPLFALLSPAPNFTVLLALRLLAALMLGVGQVLWVAPVLLLSQVAIGLRFRGTFNGGSDTMSVVVLLGLSIAAVAPTSPLALKAGLLYIAVQTTLSYFVAGIGKLKNAEWRTGTAPASFFSSERYGAPLWLRRSLSAGRCPLFLGWCVLVFECGAPLAWSSPRLCAAFVAAGLAFHLGTWLLFGLNRFVWIWTAAYPALLAASQLLNAAR